MATRYSIVEYYGEQEKYRCGYCKNPNTNFSHGMWAHSLTVQDYQSLIDRGWRRSGCYCYKPTMDQTCCPLYSIKCEALNFIISKSQKKILKRMAKFLRNELTNDNVTVASEDQRDNIDNNHEIPNYIKYFARAQKNAPEMNVLSVDDELNAKLSNNPIEVNKSGEQILKNCTSVPSSSQKHSKNLNEKSTFQGRNKIINEVPCKKAKVLRIERKKNKLLAQGKSQSEIEAIFKEKKQQNYIKTLEELFDEVHTSLKKLELKLVRIAPMSSEYLKTSKRSYEIYNKYQTTIHGIPAKKVTERQYTRFLVKSPLQIKLVRVLSDEFFSTFDISANLYKKYQMTIHGDSPEECDQKSFFNFLVKSPLQAWTPNNGGPPQGYGSFHEQYWLNNELIAVGVIDILPFCVSSVYFFYDPVYYQLSLGTFSSLREVYLTRQLNKVANDLKYYYMGFYIHTCPKMRYKAKMKPSKLLCPETYTWCNIEPCLIKLDNTKYSRLNDNIDTVDEDGIIDIQKVQVLYNKIAMPYKIYKIRLSRQITQQEECEVKDYATFVGMRCAERMLLYRS